MGQGMSAVERAFQVAKSGRVGKVSELIRSLEREGFNSGQIYGPLLRRELTALIRTARKESGRDDVECASEKGATTVARRL